MQYSFLLNKKETSWERLFHLVSSSSHEADNEQFTKWAAQRFQTAKNWTRSEQVYLIISLYPWNFQSLELWNECLCPFPHLDTEAQATRHQERGLSVGYACGALTMQFLTVYGEAGKPTFSMPVYSGEDASQGYLHTGSGYFPTSRTTEK